MLAFQILLQLLQVKGFDPQEVLCSFICSLRNVVGVNQILQQAGSMVMRELHLCLGVVSTVECYVLCYGNQVMYAQGADQVAYRAEVKWYAVFLYRCCPKFKKNQCTRPCNGTLSRHLFSFSIHWLKQQNHCQPTKHHCC